jgi:hypothetical protein
MRDVSPVVFGQGFPVVLACQFRELSGTALPIDLTNYSQVEFLAKHKEGSVIAMAVQVINAAQGTLSATIADTSSLPLGQYEIEANYIDAAGVAQSSKMDIFTLARTLKGELRKQQAAHV